MSRCSKAHIRHDRLTRNGVLEMAHRRPEPKPPSWRQVPQVHLQREEARHVRPHPREHRRNDHAVTAVGVRQVTRDLVEQLLHCNSLASHGLFGRIDLDVRLKILCRGLHALGNLRFLELAKGRGYLVL